MSSHVACAATPAELEPPEPPAAPDPPPPPAPGTGTGTGTGVGAGAGAVKDRVRVFVEVRAETCATTMAPAWVACAVAAATEAVCTDVERKPRAA
jgi:hypothetical protein